MPSPDSHNPGRRTPRFALLCFGFVICGVVTVLPGPLLPLLAARWRLPDVQSGTFFTAEFAAATLGAILSGYRPRLSLPAGYALMAGGILLLRAAATMGHGLALTAFAVTGFGIGLSVTATNLSVGTEGPARARRLSLVNLWWGVGAVGCPWLISAAERTARLPLLMVTVALASAVTFAVLASMLRSTDSALPERQRASTGQEKTTLLFFAAFLFLYVGVENAVGGWIATYAHRFNGLTLAAASLTVSVYWLALLAGRWVGSVALRRVSERAVLVTSLVLALGAVAVLVAPRSPAAMLAAVAVAGAGFGPVFPVGVARMLGRLSDHRNTGWVFAMCAGGGAVLPWLTGLVSTGTGSLRVGFGVPVGAVAVILALALAENAILREPEPAQAAKESV